MVRRITSANSVESWDFPTTPLASTHRRCFSEELFTTNDKNSNTSPLSSEAEVSPSEQAKRGNIVSSSSASGTSNSSIVLNSITTPSTSPSSYTESMGPACGVQEKLSSESKPGLEPFLPISENTNQHTAASSESSRPAPSPCTPSPQFIASSTVTPITLTNQPGLWRKVKNNVRPSSATDDEGSDNSPRKERGKFGGIFASASKSLLSSRSLANGISTVFGFKQREDWDMY